MLTGTWPFRGKTTIDVRHAVLHDPAPPISQLRTSGVPARLQSVVDRALEKEPKDRFQNVEDFRSELRLVLQEVDGSSPGVQSFSPEPPRHQYGANPVSRAVRWLKSITRTDQPQMTTSPRQSIDETPQTTVADREKKSLAILPFRNLSNDPSKSFYEFSLADAVITELARVRSLIVRPSSVIAKYQGQLIDSREVGQELNVNAVLAAGFMHAGDTFRVTAQLLDVTSGEIIWSDRIDTAASDIIALQDTIAQRIVEGLRLELSPSEQVGTGKASTKNPAAYEQYLRGRDLFARFIFRSLSAEDCAGAIQHFERAIDLDSNFALAYGGLGAAYVNRVFKGFGGSEDYEQAEEAFKKALSIDANIIEARMLMVFVYLWRGEKQKAREAVNQTRKEAPNEAVVYFVKAMLHRLDGEYRRALRSYDRLVRLDPAAHVVASYSRALVYMYMGLFDEAFKQLDNAAEPDNPLVRTMRALGLYYTGQTDAAADLMRDVVGKHPNMHGIRPFLAMFLSVQGKHDEAIAQLNDDVKRNGEVDADIAYSIGSVYALEGVASEAFAGSSGNVTMRVRPLLRSLLRT
jgi:TolB-like protein/tetratricopeptide (TPR) repeat protein